MISKQVKNTGYSGGHGMVGMSRAEVAIETRIQDMELVDSHKGHVVGCGVGGCTFRLDADKYSSDDALALGKVLNKGACPCCGGAPSVGKEVWKQVNPDFDSSEVRECQFNVGSKVIVALYVPAGFRRLPKVVVKAFLASRPAE